MKNFHEKTPPPAPLMGFDKYTKILHHNRIGPRRMGPKKDRSKEGIPKISKEMSTNNKLSIEKQILKEINDAL